MDMKNFFLGLAVVLVMGGIIGIIIYSGYANGMEDCQEFRELGFQVVDTNYFTEDVPCKVRTNYGLMTINKVKASGALNIEVYKKR